MQPLRAEADAEPAEKIVYGEDNRREVCEVTDPDLLRLSELVCREIDKSRITASNVTEQSLSTVRTHCGDWT
jgi:hypothetical protein